MENRRSEPRQRCYMGGRVVSKRDNLSFECLVRDISPQGARLVFGALEYLPTDFVLELRARGRAHKARLVWRDTSDVGIVFDGQVPLSA